MAKLIECKACGQTIATTARACPSCGAPSMASWQRWAMIIILTVIIGGWVIAALVGSAT